MERLTENAELGLPRTESDVRIGLRTLLLFVALFALTAAMSGVLSRGSGSRQKVAICTFWGGAVMGLIGWSVLAAWWRYRLERRAGAVLARMQMTVRYAPRFWRRMQLPAIVLLAAYTIFIMTRATIGISRENDDVTFEYPFYFAAGICGTTMIPAVMATLWNRTVRICENGVVCADRLIPWESVVGCYWHPRQTDVLVVSRRWRTAAAMIVPPEERHTVEALLKSKLRERSVKPDAN